MRILALYLDRLSRGSSVAPCVISRLHSRLHSHYQYRYKHQRPHETPILSSAQARQVISDLKAGYVTRAHLSRIEADLPRVYLGHLLSDILSLSVSLPSADDVSALFHLRALAPPESKMANVAQDALRKLIRPEQCVVRRIHPGNSDNDDNSNEDTIVIETLARASAERSPQPVANAEEFRERLVREDVRMYAAFYGDRPLAWVECVLSSKIPTSFHDINNDFQVPSASAATSNFCVFYSLAIVDDSARGLGVAANLLRRVVSLSESEVEADSGSDDSRMRYVTMSPIPRFRRMHPEANTAPEKGAVVRYLKARRCGVCRFHLRNGAVLLDVLLDADGSELRVSESFGAMAMYEYIPRDVERNAAEYSASNVVKSAV